MPNKKILEKEEREMLLSDLPEMAYIDEKQYSPEYRKYNPTNTGMFYVRFLKAVPKSKSKMIAVKIFDFEDYIYGREEALYWAKDWRDDKYIELIEAGIWKKFPKRKYSRVGVRWRGNVKKQNNPTE